MERVEHPLRLPVTGATIDTSGMFGLERSADRLLRAVGPSGQRAKIGVRDDIAYNLAALLQPDSDDVSTMLSEGERDDALNEAYQFVLAWDKMAPGEIELAFLRDNPDMTMCLPGIIAVRCLDDGLFHIVNAATNEASHTGGSADVAARIIKGWGGLEAAAQQAREYEPVGSLAAILSARWDSAARAVAAADGEMAATAGALAR